MYSGEPSLMVILLIDCRLYIDSDTCVGSTVDGCGSTGLIVSYKIILIFYTYTNPRVKSSFIHKISII